MGEGLEDRDEGFFFGSGNTSYRSEPSLEFHSRTRSPYTLNPKPYISKNYSKGPGVETGGGRGWGLEDPFQRSQVGRV